MLTLKHLLSKMKKSNKNLKQLLADLLEIPVLKEKSSNYFYSLLGEITDGNYNSGCVKVKDTDLVYVSGQTNGGGMQLALFKNDKGIKIGQFEVGVNNTPKDFKDVLLPLPAGTTKVCLSSSLNVPLTVKMKAQVAVINKGILDFEVSKLEDRTKNLIAFDPLTLNMETGTGYYTTANATYTAWNGYKSGWLDIKDTDELTLSGKISGAATQFVLFKNANNAKVGIIEAGQNGIPVIYNNVALTIPAGATKAYFTFNSDYDFSVKRKTVLEKIVTSATLKTELKYIYTHVDDSFLWIGHSIPKGGKHPELSAQALKATCINNCIGSSMLRNAKADGTINGLAYQNKMWCFTDTVAQKTALINDWNTTKGLLVGSPDVLTQADKDFILSTSYERLLLPFLDGTNPMPSVFVIEHGNNDNIVSDSDEVFTSIPAIRNDKGTYLGAMNFVCDLILQYNPYAKIVIIGHYENARKTRISTAQLNFANYRGFPLLKTWERTGFTQNKIPNTQALWATAPWNAYTAQQIADGKLTAGDLLLDMPATRYYMPDDLHPHSDPTGKTGQRLANIVTPFLRSI